MTLVVTTASAHGITVVGDRAVTRRTSDDVTILEARKVWYSPTANIGLAFWGNVYLPDSSMESWTQEFVNGITKKDTVSSIAERLASSLNAVLEPLGLYWSQLRRGIHVSGYEHGLPVIFHVHTGDPRAFHHALEVHRDFPDLLGGGVEKYQSLIEAGGRAQLRNGAYELFVTVATLAEQKRGELSALLKTPVPAPTLAGQAAFDAALVRFSSDLIASADLPRTVGPDLDVVAFTANGQVVLSPAQPVDAPDPLQRVR